MIDNYIKIFFITVLMFFLTACNQGIQNIKEDYDLNESEKSIVILSLTQNNNTSAVKVLMNKETSKGYVKYENLHSRIKTGLMPGYDKGDFPWYKPGGTPWQTRQKDKDDVNGFMGRLIVIELDPGNYSLKHWRIQLNRDQYEINTRYAVFPIKYPKEVKFNVKGGRVHYIGNLNFDIVNSAKITPKFSDAYDRDITLFRKKYPELASKPVIKEMPYTGYWYPQR